MAQNKNTNYMPTFVVGYIPHQDSNFYVCLDKDKHYTNVEDNIAYFKSKRQVIVFRYKNAHARTLKLDAQQPFMLHV